LKVSAPLAGLLDATADAVAAVRAGRSLTEALAATPAVLRPGTQSLAFQALRGLGGAQARLRLLAPKAPPPWVEALLLTALALAAQDEGAPYPPHTLVSQAVEAAKHRARPSAGFVNAVLRRFLREREALAARVAADPVAQWNHPAWWIDRLQRDWPGHWQALLAAANTRAPMTLRVNARRSTPAAYLERLADAGLAARVVALPGEGACQGVELAAPCPVQALPGFDEGAVSVQDLAAQQAAPLLLGMGAGALRSVAGGIESALPRHTGERGSPPPPRAQEVEPAPFAGIHPGGPTDPTDPSMRLRVLDACAAPGGKTAHLLELAGLDLLALDADAGRLVRVAETLQRLGLAARLQAADARNTAAWWDGRPFDAILLDAPCSASGIVRRHPDVRWLRRDSDIAALARTQAALLDALWPLLRPGGRLVYAVCSVFRAEGDRQIDAFLQRTPDARTLPSPGYLLPLADNPAQPVTDGFFYALLERTEAPDT
jgi:16S rRNA (cytosine967-C5)-methyltransferase